MLGTLRQSYICTCRCLLQNNTSGWSFTAVRKYENCQTAVFERMHPVNRVGRGKFPLLKGRHYILKKVPHTDAVQKTMKCILTREIDGIGLKGTVVEVEKSKFRNSLYPRGDAVYASPENIALYDAYRKDSEEEGITYEIKQQMRKMARFHLRVFMNSQEKWTLTPAHLRIAFRKMGVIVKEENIMMPDKPVQTLGDFTFRLQMFDKIACQVRGAVYPIGKNGLPDTNQKYPPIWGNPPVDKSKVTEYIKKTANVKGDEESVSEQSAEDIGEESDTISKDAENNNEEENDKPDKR